MDPGLETAIEESLKADGLRRATRSKLHHVIRAKLNALFLHEVICSSAQCLISPHLQVQVAADGDCQFNALLPSLVHMTTLGTGLCAHDVQTLRVLASDYLRSNRDAPSSYCSATDTYSTWSGDIVASLRTVEYWTRYRRLDFDTYCDALLRPGGEPFVQLDLIGA
jgi:hypothetical protein